MKTLHPYSLYAVYNLIQRGIYFHLTCVIFFIDDQIKVLRTLLWIGHAPLFKRRDTEKYHDSLFKGETACVY